MRKKGQSWFLPLLVLFVVIWAIGKKDSPKTEPPAIQASVNTLASNSSPAPHVNVEIKVESVEVTGISVPVHPYVPRLRSILHQAKSAVEIRSDSRFR